MRRDAACASGRWPARSRGERMRRTRPIGPDIGPARNVRSLTSQIRRPCSSNRRHAAPAPGANPSNAATRASASSGTTSSLPSGQRYVNCGSRRCISSSSASEVPAARKRSSRTLGSVTSDGPTSNVAPSWRTAASLPPDDLVALEDHHAPASRGEADGDGEAAHPRPDDHDVGALTHGPPGPRPGPPAAASPRRRRRRRGGRRRTRRTRAPPSPPCRRRRRRAPGPARRPA